MIEAQQVQDRGVKVGHGDFVLGHVVAELVGLAVGHAATDAVTLERRRQ